MSEVIYNKTLVLVWGHFYEFVGETGFPDWLVHCVYCAMDKAIFFPEDDPKWAAEEIAGVIRKWIEDGEVAHE